MSRTKVVLVHEGFRDLLHDPEVREILREKAEAMANLAGDGFESLVYSNYGRDVARVYPATPKARSINFKENTLLKVMQI